MLLGEFGDRDTLIPLGFEHLPKLDQFLARATLPGSGGLARFTICLVGFLEQRGSACDDLLKVLDLFSREGNAR
jgi:hypothetical protein